MEGRTDRQLLWVTPAPRPHTAGGSGEWAGLAEGTGHVPIPAFWGTGSSWAGWPTGTPFFGRAHPLQERGAHPFCISSVLERGNKRLVP